VLLTFVVPALLAIFISPYLIRYMGTTVGLHIRSKTESRRALLFSRAKEEESKSGSKRDAISKDDQDVNHDWKGVIGFFHPFWYLYISQPHLALALSLTFLKQCRWGR